MIRFLPQRYRLVPTSLGFTPPLRESHTQTICKCPTERASIRPRQQLTVCFQVGRPITGVLRFKRLLHASRVSSENAQKDLTSAARSVVKPVAPPNARRRRHHDCFSSPERFL